MAFIINKEKEEKTSSNKTQDQWNMKESSLSDPVKEWLESQGYKFHAEVPFPMASYAFIDVVGTKDQDVICIELKASLTEKVIYQANHSKLLTDKAYVCVLSKPKQTSIDKCQKYGIGILILVDNQIKVLLEPKIDEKTWNPMVKGLHETLVNGWFEGKAGLPNMKGQGAAISVLELVRQAREKDPKITWKELFDKIPNHYSTYKSMQQSMGKAIEREIRKNRKK